MKIGDLVYIRNDEPKPKKLEDGSIGIIVGISLATLDENQMRIPDFPIWLVILSHGKQWTICETDLETI